MGNWRNINEEKGAGNYTMVTEVYIGKVKSDTFDFDAKGDWAGYFPEALCEKQICHELYYDIVGDAREKKLNAKQVDWGCFVIKLNKADLIAYLDKDKYKNVNSAERRRLKPVIDAAGTLFCEKKQVEYLIDIAKNLSDGEYVLVALEGISLEEFLDDL